MQENPYSAFVKLLRTDSQERRVDPWRFGTVAGLEPLKIELAGEILEGDDIYVNCQLLENKEKAELKKIEGWLKSGEIANIFDGELKTEGTFKGVLEVGDQVVLLQSSDGQRYVVLCKAVNG